MEKIKLIAVLDYSKDTRGIGVTPALIYTRDPKVAKAIVDHEFYNDFSLAGLGKEKTDTAEREIVIMDSLDEYLAHFGALETENKKRAALSKLTKDDIKILGLDKK